MYESRNMPLISFRAFLKRILLHFGGAVLLVIFTLFIGMVGHILFDENIGWHDATLNSAFIANGIGPYIMPQSIAGKIFFAFYGMFTSLVFMTTLGLVLAPVAHRVLHKFHLDDNQD
ncbi:Uncharacterised protein [Yersinia frederiksenii]|uniref:Two pore domain potassium channel family protein n=2 Tax=Yersinia alsatica TaxID=2890317 RepID=A0ABY5USU4_9GAMM|nr:hypothetical protein [Yersinia alsatica]OWF70298.1 hypothetical protein B4901_02500 [Yersinia frederiksenii]UWM46576.1 two pore domain potassium channel family protein [Yersinia alsatica]CND64339.1 Uncharacterised protein [Yersinia frederiksenii]CNI70032.1 Uncharacterised protein [Yersinia frederiksenii]CNK31638.1 Uncharacterised protein [Yersinia frederiksenii]